MSVESLPSVSSLVYDRLRGRAPRSSELTNPIVLRQALVLVHVVLRESWKRQFSVSPQTWPWCSGLRGPKFFLKVAKVGGGGKPGIFWFLFNFLSQLQHLRSLGYCAPQGSIVQAQKVRVCLIGALTNINYGKLALKSHVQGRIDNTHYAWPSSV